LPLTAAILIGFYILALVLVLKWPSRQRHPEDGQAIGCLMLVIVGLLGLGGLLALGVVFDLRWLTTTIFYMVMFPLVLATPQLLFGALRNRRQKALRKGTPIPAEALNAAVSGQTHEFRRQGPEPRGEWAEVRFFSPDGRLICFERDGEKVVPQEKQITWSTRDGRLETIGDIRPGNRNVSTLWQTPEGQIAYYIHAPFSRLNRRLSKLTTAIRVGPPKENSAEAPAEEPRTQ
jgi:hypothetical protein